MRLRLTSEAGFDEIGEKAAKLFHPISSKLQRNTPPLAGFFDFWVSVLQRLRTRPRESFAAVIGEAARNSLNSHRCLARLPPRFFLLPLIPLESQARHSFGAVMPPAEQRAQRKAPR